MVNKTHHAMVDRIGAVDVAAAILDVNRRSRDLPEQPWIPNPSPSEIDLVVDAVADLTTRPSEVVRHRPVRRAGRPVRGDAGCSARPAALEVVRRTVNPGAPLAAERRARVVSAGSPRSTPTSADFKAVRGAHGGSVNDVILTVITGALRYWLLSRGEPVTPHTVVRAMVPVSVRPGPDAESDESGSVASYLIDLPVAEPNPVMRLHQVSFAMGGHLESGRQVGADALVELGRFSPPTLHALGARVAGQLSRRMYNVLITNVPGPADPAVRGGFPGRRRCTRWRRWRSGRRSPCRAPRTTAACSSG